MRLKIFLGLAVASLFLAMGSTVQAAQTCEQVAGWCVKKGGSQADCFSSSRMETCRSTGSYIAPNGSVWPATTKKK